MLYLCRVTSQYTEKEIAILEAALRLFVEKGFHAAPTSKIAKAAGVSNGTLFHYFKTKDILIRELYFWIKELKIQAVAGELENIKGVKNKVKYLFLGTIDWLIENPKKNFFNNQIEFSPLVEIFLKNSYNEHAHVYLSVFEKGIKERVFNDHCVDWMYVTFKYQILSVTQYVRLRPKAKNDKKLREDAFNIFWKAFAKK